MSGANFTPEFEGYTGQKPFRFWCQKVLPLVYDDSLSYYELLCKVISYLNNTIEDVSNLETNVNALLVAYENLQDYVNTQIGGIEHVTDEIRSDMGVLSELATVTKTNLVAAINEVNTVAHSNSQDIHELYESIGDLANLTTTVKATIVAAINEVNNKARSNEEDIHDISESIGNLTNLTTTVKSNLVGAINEVNKPLWFYVGANISSETVGDYDTIPFIPENFEPFGITPKAGDLLVGWNGYIGEVIAVVNNTIRYTATEWNTDNLSALQTQHKDSIVSAINEVNGKVSDLEDKAQVFFVTADISAETVGDYDTIAFTASNFLPYGVTPKAGDLLVGWNGYIGEVTAVVNSTIRYMATEHNMDNLAALQTQNKTSIVNAINNLNRILADIEPNVYANKVYYSPISPDVDGNVLTLTFDDLYPYANENTPAKINDYVLCNDSTFYRISQVNNQDEIVTLQSSGELLTVPFVVTFSGTTASNNATCDKTFTQLKQAIESGRQIVCKYNTGTQGNYAELFCQYSIGWQNNHVNNFHFMYLDINTPANISDGYTFVNGTYGSNYITIEYDEV